jgi:diadenosine tetraphosphate (Ap4A) HIT family hydrolase
MPPQPGTTVVIFRGARHVADPCDFTDEELTGYWTDMRAIAKAIEGVYQPGQLNYMTFGNAVPHVHTHIGRGISMIRHRAGRCRMRSSGRPRSWRRGTWLIR